MLLCYCLIIYLEIDKQREQKKQIIKEKKNHKNGLNMRAKNMYAVSEYKMCMESKQKKKNLKNGAHCAVLSLSTRCGDSKKEIIKQQKSRENRLKRPFMYVHVCSYA